MLRKILVGLVVLVGVLAVYVAFQPAHYSVSREKLIKASPEVIFPHINNSQKMNDWMPWKDQDPNLQMSYSGPAEGVGSVSSWSGEKMGDGQSEVVESIPNQKVTSKLTYTRPMDMKQMAIVTLTPSAEGTNVKWEIEGENSFLGRFMCLFANMDKMVGGEFEKGLAKLQATVETPKP